MVDLKHQRKGLGRWLTRACNEVADKANQPTYIRARPDACAMVQKEGYEMLEHVDFDLAPCGCNGIARISGLVRYPVPLDAASKDLPENRVSPD